MGKNREPLKYVYGPVSSWRLGASLGIDPISEKTKICTYDCVYCQLGRTDSFTDGRTRFVETAEIIKELRSIGDVKADFITFSGRGEPTLAENLGQMIRAVRKARKEKIAVITNSSLLCRDDVQEDLMGADIVIAKLDAHSKALFEDMNRPMETIKFDAVVSGLKDFRKRFKGSVELQIMFTAANRGYAGEIASLCREISPDRVYLNTPLRHCESTIVTEQEMGQIEAHFGGLEAMSVYRAEKRAVTPISTAETMLRRGKSFK